MMRRARMGMNILAAALLVAQAGGTTAADLPAWRRAARSRDSVEALEGRALLAAHYRREGDLEQAFAALKGLGELTPLNLQDPRSLAFAEYARCLAASGELLAAFRLLDYASTRISGVGKIWIEEARAFCLALNRRPQDALVCCEAAAGQCAADLKELNALSETDAADGRRRRLLTEAQARLAAAIDDLRFEVASERFGRDYALYCKAQRWRLAGKLAEADGVYQIVIESGKAELFREAARFYQALCATGQDAVRQRGRRLRAFVADDTYGLYRGEALLTLAHDALTEEWRLKEACERYEAVIDWCRKVRDTEQILKTQQLAERTRLQTAPPPDIQWIDMGIVVRRELAPHQLVNRDTAPWYIDDLERRALYGAAFCEMCQEQWEKAESRVEAILNLDPFLQQVTEARVVSTYSRLKMVCKLKRFCATDPELKGVPKPLRLRIQYADFLYLQRRWAEATDHYERCLAAARAADNDPAAALALLGLSNVCSMQARQREAIVHIQEVLHEYPRVSAAGRAAFYLANLNGMLHFLGPTRERELEAELALYEQARKQGRGTFVEENAMGFSVAALAEAGKLDEARRLADALIKAYPDSNWQEFVKSYLAAAAK